MRKLYKFFIMLIAIFSVLFFNNKIYGKYMFSEELQAYNISIRNWETNIRSFSITNDKNLEFKILDGDTVIADNEITNSNIIKYDKEYILEIYNNSDYYYNFNINASGSEINSFTELLELNITNFEENTSLFNGTSGVTSNSYLDENKNFISIPEFIPTNTPLKFKFKISTDLLKEVEKDNPNYITENNGNIQFNISTSLPTWNISATENDNVTATLYGNTLRITGNGNMKDLMNLPWSKYRGNITKVEIENGITNIGNYAFLAYTSLTSIEIPDSVTSIGELAFCGCTSLENITLPSSITSIGKQAFQQCTNLKEVKGFENTKIITIEYQLFFKCPSLKSIKIPSSATTIKNNAFIECTTLTSIEIPDSVTTIGSSVFSDWTKDQTIYCDFYSQPNTWDSSWDAGCNANIVWKIRTWDISATKNDNVIAKLYGDVLKVTGTGNMKDFNNRPWEDYVSDITKVEIENGITNIGNSAFASFTSLTNIDIPDSVTSVGESAFVVCTSLTSITLPNSITSIGNFAFIYCSSLTNINIPDGVTSIGESAFIACTSLGNITLPSSITSIGESAFQQCTNLKEVIGFENTKITIIEYQLFYECPTLTSIKIPNSVTTIKNNAFIECTALTNIEIPSSVITIGNSVFHDWTKDQTIYCDFYSQPNTWDSSWDAGCNANIVWKSNVNITSNIKESTFVNNIDNVYKKVPQAEEFQVNIYGES